MAMDCENDTISSDYGQDLLKFMYCLRVLLRDTHAVAFVTIPAHLFDVSSFPTWQFNKWQWQIIQTMNVILTATVRKYQLNLFNFYYVYVPSSK